MFSKKQYKLLMKAKEEGGISGREAREIYQSKSSAYMNLNRMSKAGFLKKCEAPENSKNKFIFMITNKGEEYVSLLDPKLL